MHMTKPVDIIHVLGRRLDEGTPPLMRQHLPILEQHLVDGGMWLVAGGWWQVVGGRWFEMVCNKMGV